MGSLFNHSTSHLNVGWQRDLDDQTITYRALRDIDKGEELCISYGRLWFKDADEDTDGSSSNVDPQGDGFDVLQCIELDVL